MAQLNRLAAPQPTPYGEEAHVDSDVPPIPPMTLVQIELQSPKVSSVDRCAPTHYILSQDRPERLPTSVILVRIVMRNHGLKHVC